MKEIRSRIKSESREEDDEHEDAERPSHPAAAVRARDKSFALQRGHAPLGAELTAVALHQCVEQTICRIEGAIILRWTHVHLPVLVDVETFATFTATDIGSISVVATATGFHDDILWRVVE